MWGDVSSWMTTEYGGVIFKSAGSTALPFTRGLKLTNNPKGTKTLNLDSSDSNTMADKNSLLNSGFSLSQMIVVFQVHRYNISSWNGNTITISSNFLDTFYPSVSKIFIGQNEGLPNITGKIYANDWALGINLGLSGAFSGTNSNKSTPSNSHSTNNLSELNFNASNSNSIYGNSSNVTPTNITKRLWIRES